MEWDSLLQEIDQSLDSKLLDSKLLDSKPTPRPERSSPVPDKQDSICEDCGIPGRMHDGIICCPQCGMCRKVVYNQYNYCNYSSYVTSGHHMVFQITGKNSYSNNRNLMQSCSNYKEYSRLTTERSLLEENFQYKGNKIPRDVILLAVDILFSVKAAGYVFRGNGKKGIEAACVFYACVIKGVTKRPSDIAEIFGVGERFLSQGDRMLQDLKERGIIDIPTFLRPMNDYIKQYFLVLHIPDKYASFVTDLIDRADKKHIHIMNESRMTTKCVGAILLLTTRVRELRHITKDVIWKECRISKSTFTRYCILLEKNYDKLRLTFKAHGIPMPNEWRKTAEYVQARREACLLCTTAKKKPPWADMEL
jgi:transcription initiation factor TFIIIB Brf1 subunit/transcription initiation factor TFIIB